MSFEYTLKILSNKSIPLISNLEKVLDGGCLTYFHRPDGQFLIKDPSISSSWNYDISIKKETHGDFHIALVGWSLPIYQVFKEALKGQIYEIYDDDADEKISIENLFRRP